jgi:colanic acid/amylovoran biosynthesis glycosyltransferase
MKILVVTNIFETTVNGPFYLPHWLLKINALYPIHEVRVVTDDVAVPTDKIYKININHPRRLKNFASVIDNLPFYRACRRIKKEYDYDIIFFNVATLGALTSRLLPKNIKIWGVVHTDHYILPDRRNYKSFKAYLYFAYLEHGLERAVMRNFNRVFFCSDYTRLVFERFFPKHTPKMHTLLQTIDIKYIPFNPIPIHTDTTIKILFVKSDVMRGRIYILIDALAQLPEYRFVLTIIGASRFFENDIRAWLEKNDAKNITLDYRGAQPLSAVYAAVQTHQILCMPVHSEALGLANVEGLAHGISVVATNVGGIPEVMNGGKNGWLVKPDNIESLRTGLKNCIECPADERLEIQKNARLFVEQNFDYREMLPYFVSFLE